MSELIINGKNALQTWGVRMGDGFIDALNAPLTMKEYIENESRLEHGKRMIVNRPRIASREVTLSFTIEGNSISDYMAKKKMFESELYNGTFNVNIPNVSEDVFKLVYMGRASSYGQSKDRAFGKFSVKFVEPNPADRQ